MIIIDDFLSKDSTLFKAITADSLWESSLPYKFMSMDTYSNDVWQKMVKHIWAETSKFGILPDYCAGIEYWSGIIHMNGNTDLPWHYDKDEHLHHTTGTIKTPYIGSVYYAHSEIPDGGFLEIDRGGDIERIQPVPNRLIIFDSGTVHRVVPITSGLRRTLATNLWVEKPSDENYN